MEKLALKHPEDEGTYVRRFLAHRGAVIVKEVRHIGKLKGIYGDSISVETIILAIVKGANRDTSFGVKLERHEDNTPLDSSAFLDFDELGELIQSFDFISSLASELHLQQRDYTEVTYSTKENARFGFYQDENGQQAFIALSVTANSLFLSVDHLSRLKEMLLNAQEHLMSRGATQV